MFARGSSAGLGFEPVLAEAKWGSVNPVIGQIFHVVIKISVSAYLRDTVSFDLSSFVEASSLEIDGIAYVLKRAKATP